MLPCTEAGSEADLLWGFVTKAPCQLLWDGFKDLSYSKSPKVGWSKAISGNLRQRGENWSFHFPFLCLYICPLSVLCGILCAASPRQSNEGHVCSKQGHCYRGSACMANLVACPVPPTTLSLKAALPHIHIWTITKSSSRAGTLPGTQSTGGESPGKAQTPLTLTSQSQEKCWNHGTWIMYRALSLYTAWTARQETAACHQTGRD